MPIWVELRESTSIHWPHEIPFAGFDTSLKSVWISVTEMRKWFHASQWNNHDGEWLACGYIPLSQLEDQTRFQDEPIPSRRSQRQLKEKDQRPNRHHPDIREENNASLQYVGDGTAETSSIESSESDTVVPDRPNIRCNCNNMMHRYSLERLASTLEEMNTNRRQLADSTDRLVEEIRRYGKHGA